MQLDVSSEAGAHGRAARLEHVLDHAAHVLPAQGPISIFIHHNPLHALEHLTFEQAVVQAARLYGCEPYMTEQQYRDELARGRILERDLDAVVTQDLGERGTALVSGLSPRKDLWLAMLHRPLWHERGAALEWHLAEMNALARLRADVSGAPRQRLLDWAHARQRGSSERRAERRVVDSLWQACLRAAGLAPENARTITSEVPVRHRDLLVSITHRDSDQLVHPVLIRLCAAFLDQGIAYWPMPDRQLGLYRVFRTLYAQEGPPLDRWMAGLREELAEQEARNMSACDVVLESLELLGVDEPEWQEFLTETLLALRGWAGMIRQIETRPDRVPAYAPPATLLDFIAVRLVLERLALAHVAAGELAFKGPLAEVRAYVRARIEPVTPWTVRERAFQLFQLAQLLGIVPDDIAALSPAAVEELYREMDAFSEMERRRLFHLAYERRHRTGILDALAAHTPARSTNTIKFQAVFCLDEREESIRRHLEEIEPACATYGTAGFFGVAMYYRGAADAHPRPLCPVVIRPEHEVHEVARQDVQKIEKRRAQRRRVMGHLTRSTQVGSRTFTRGTLITAALGSVATIPLVFRVLFPRWAARIERGASVFWRPPEHTRLTLERTNEVDPRLGKWLGFTLDEMVAIVQRLLQEIGLTEGFAPYVFMLGHGSSSLNNPHESAYDCGACGGGRGGPNARAFAQMANDPRVRQVLAERGITIPEETIFIGGQHNTCEDSITLFDTARLPKPRKRELRAIRQAFDQARTRNAHERCRRFISAPTWLPPVLALPHVEARAADLAQPRPEAGHATNAVCIVGRRSRTRGLYLDRRAFLVSYDPNMDDQDGTILARIMAAVSPVGAGINLEYYFSYVDSAGYGCGTKLPHNITSLLGVMDGHASDLRTGLPWQMVEIHEPVRLLVIIEAKPEIILRVAERNEQVGRLIRNRWIQAVALSPTSNTLHVFGPGGFEPYEPESPDLPVVASSIEWYRGRREHLGCARIAREDAPSEQEVVP